MFMRTILALSLAAFALAVPVAQPLEGRRGPIGALLRVIEGVVDKLAGEYTEGL
ncbi:hypothetical protein H4582DRAFT_2084028 [Lactarius indigo]|nr:hypothetical protein H4582DRAFT_2084028 [Lactarius indigo]